MEKRFVAPLTESEQQTLASAYHHGEKRALQGIQVQEGGLDVAACASDLPVCLLT